MQCATSLCCVSVLCLTLAGAQGTAPQSKAPRDPPNQGNKPEAQKPSEPSYEGRPLSYWVNELKSDNRTARTAAAVALGNMGPEARAAIPALLAALKQDYEGYVLATAALTKIGAPAKGAIPDILPSLQDDYPPLRYWAAKVVGTLGPEAKGAVPALLPLLKDEEWFVRVAAHAALQNIGPAAEDRSILAFHGMVMRQIKSPPDEVQLNTLGQAKVGELFVSFIGTADGKVLVAQLSATKPAAPHKKMYLTPRFVDSTIDDPGPGSRKVFPVKKATAGDLVHWGYVYDRNGDGKIDYVAFLFGALPVKGKHFPKDYPKGERVQGEDALRAVLTIIKHSQLVFRHFVDDNFDGEVDAIVLEDMDFKIIGQWIDRWLFIRGSKAGDKLEAAWYFRENIWEKLADAIPVNGRYRVQLAGPTERASAFGPADLARTSEYLRIMNEGARQCALPKGSIPRQ